MSCCSSKLSYTVEKSRSFSVTQLWWRHFAVGLTSFTEFPESASSRHAFGRAAAGRIKPEPGDLTEGNSVVRERIASFSIVRQHHQPISLHANLPCNVVILLTQSLRAQKSGIHSFIHSFSFNFFLSALQKVVNERIGLPSRASAKPELGTQPPPLGHLYGAIGGRL